MAEILHARLLCSKFLCFCLVVVVCVVAIVLFIVQFVVIFVTVGGGSVAVVPLVVAVLDHVFVFVLVLVVGVGVFRLRRSAVLVVGCGGVGDVLWCRCVALLRGLFMSFSSHQNLKMLIISFST